jgi:hypothetical protein
MTRRVLSSVGLASSATLFRQNDRAINRRTLRKDLQFSFRHGELREAAMQTDHELRKDPHDGFVQTFESGEMDSNFAVENALLIGLASFAVHSESVPLHGGLMLRLAAMLRLFKIDHFP